MTETVLDIDIARSVPLSADKKAKQVMEGALSFAEAEGYVRPFLKYCGNDLSALLQRLKSSRPNSSASSCKLKTITGRVLLIDKKGLVGATTRLSAIL